MRWLSGLAAVVLVAATLFFLREDRDVAPESLTPIEEHEPDIYGKDVSFNQLHLDGTLHYRLRASAIRQFNREELTRMTQPELHLLAPAQPPWDITSQHGYIRKRPDPQGVPEEVVYLRERVELLQIHPESGRMTMRSEAFYIYPDRQYAETDQDVIIDSTVGRTKAAGLQANLASGVVKLSSRGGQRVHTIVLPEQFKNS